MKKRHSNKLNSYQGVLGLLKESGDIHKDSPQLARSVERLDKMIDKLLQVGITVTRGSKPTTMAKENARKELAEEAAVMAGLLRAYAYDTADVNLEKKADISYTKLYYGRHVETKLKAMVVESMLTKYREGLKPYMSDDKQIDNLRKLIDRYETLSVKSGGTVPDVKAARQEIDRIIHEIDLLLDKKIDNLVLGLKSKHPKFYTQYRIARQIIDL